MYLHGPLPGFAIRLSAFCALFTGYGCVQVPDLPLCAQSDHVILHTDRNDVNCDLAEEWLLNWMEPSLSALARTLGIPASQRPAVKTFVFSSIEDMWRYCRRPATGCFGEYKGERHVLGTDFHMPHEFVHAFASVVGSPPKFLQEGLAEVLGEEGLAYGQRTEHDFDVMSAIVNFGNWSANERFGAYSSAGVFVRFLIDRYGMADFMRLYGSLPEDANEAQVEETFHVVFGEDVYDVIALFRERQLSMFGGAAIHIAQCEMPELQLNNGIYHGEIPLLWGPRHGQEKFSNLRTLEFQTASVMRLRLPPSDTAFVVEMHGCDFDYPTEFSTVSPSSNWGVAEVWSRVMPGKYWILASYYGDLSPGAVELSLDTSSNAFGSDEPQFWENELELVQIDWENAVCAERRCFGSSLVEFESDRQIRFSTRAIASTPGGDLEFLFAPEDLYICELNELIDPLCQGPIDSTRLGFEMSVRSGVLYQISWGESSAQSTTFVISATAP
jgi:hypothetical protein